MEEPSPTESALSFQLSASIPRITRESGCFSGKTLTPDQREGRPGPGMGLLLIQGDALSPREFPRGISERALQTEADSSAVPGGGRSWERPSSRAAENGRRGGGPLGSFVWQRGALLLEVPLSLEEPVLLGPPEGLWGSRGSGWGAPVTTAASVTGSIHSSCV